MWGESAWVRTKPVLPDLNLEHRQRAASRRAALVYVWTLFTAEHGGVHAERSWLQKLFDNASVVYRGVPACLPALWERERERDGTSGGVLSLLFDSWIHFLLMVLPAARITRESSVALTDPFLERRNAAWLTDFFCASVNLWSEIRRIVLRGGVPLEGNFLTKRGFKQCSKVNFVTVWYL